MMPHPEDITAALFIGGIALGLSILALILAIGAYFV